MSHYYDADQSRTKSAPMQTTFDHAGRTYTFTTDHGVFSHGHVDPATELLLDTVNVLAKQRVLDLGCGYGVIGIVLSKRDKAAVTLSDVNERALELARVNAQANAALVRIIASVGFTNLEKTFDVIITNPPIRIGKVDLYALFEAALTHLKQHGSFWFVMHKKHGALSALKHLTPLIRTTVVKRHKGFYVIRCDKD